MLIKGFFVFVSLVIQMKTFTFSLIKKNIINLSAKQFILKEESKVLCVWYNLP